MNVLDIILIFLLLCAVWNGVRKGFVVQLGGIVAIVLGIWLAVRHSAGLGAWLDLKLGVASQIAYYVAFALIVVACLVLIGLAGWLVGKIFNLVGLGLLNRLGGAVLSLAKTVLILGALLMAFQAINRHANLFSSRQFDRSLFCGPIVRITDAVLPFLKRAVDGIDFTGDDK